MRKAKFRIETFGNNIFEGYTLDEDFNGWACPYFTFEESEKIVEEHRKNGQTARFDQDSDTFYFDVEEDEIYSSINIDGKKLYPIGYSSWIWEEAS